ncbi:hypothetical protein LX36DRAFT_242216 [Colletotrichum falcatum]|nr:hypothetical protein LX36DRAFT_242216 [Colletotrichum falcatum]
MHCNVYHPTAVDGHRSLGASVNLDFIRNEPLGYSRPVSVMEFKRKGLLARLGSRIPGTPNGDNRKYSRCQSEVDSALRRDNHKSPETSVALGVWSDFVLADKASRAGVTTVSPYTCDVDYRPEHVVLEGMPETGERQMAPSPIPPQPATQLVLLLCRIKCFPERNTDCIRQHLVLGVELEVCYFQTGYSRLQSVGVQT